MQLNFYFVTFALVLCCSFLNEATAEEESDDITTQELETAMDEAQKVMQDADNYDTEQGDGNSEQLKLRATNLAKKAIAFTGDKVIELHSSFFPNPKKDVFEYIKGVILKLIQYMGTKIVKVVNTLLTTLFKFVRKHLKAVYKAVNIR